MIEGSKKLAVNTAIDGYGHNYAYDAIGNRTAAGGVNASNGATGTNSTGTIYVSNNLNQISSISRPRQISVLGGAEPPSAPVLVNGTNATRQLGYLNTNLPQKLELWIMRKGYSSGASPLYFEELDLFSNSRVVNQLWCQHRALLTPCSSKKISASITPVCGLNSYYWTKDGYSAAAAYEQIEVNSADFGARYLPPQTVTPTYDDDGNLLTNGQWNHTWDSENRLIQSETNNTAIAAGRPRVKVEYGYDSQGRLWKSITSTNHDAGSYTEVETIYYIRDGWNSIAEVDATTNQTTKTHAWGLDLSGTNASPASDQGAGGVGGLLATTLHDSTTASLSTRYPSYDGNGNIMCYSDKAGSITANFEYAPFGELVRETGAERDLLTYRFSTKPQEFVSAHANSQTPLVVMFNPYEQAAGNSALDNGEPVIRLNPITGSWNSPASMAGRYSGEAAIGSITLGHELSHAFGGGPFYSVDDPADGLYSNVPNSLTYENRIRASYGLPPRTTYDGTPVNY